MEISRRKLLIDASALGALGLFGVGALGARPALAERMAEKAFSADKLDAAIKELGAADASASDKIKFISAEIAENGAVVPIAVSSSLPDTEMIAVLIANNPTPLAASYRIMPGMEPEVSARYKMAGTSDVYAIVRAGGKYYKAKKEIKVTLGGCGG